MQHTGERYLPYLDEDTISYEHWHRYLFAAQFVAGKAVLDLASGEGYGSNLLARSAASVVGVDLNPDAVAHARAKYPADNLSFLEGSAEAVPVPGEHVFDVLASFETLEHLSAGAQKAFLAEAKRLLKPDGLLLISTPNRVEYTDKAKAQNSFHLHELTLDEFTEFLGGHFVEVRVRYQRVFRGSYLWGSDTARGLSEHQIHFADGEFRPAETDLKTPMYLVALCSDAPVPSPPNSLLLDPDGGVDVRGLVTTLFVDTGGGYNAGDRRPQRLPPSPGRFRVGFAVGRAVRGLRWDPLELRTCRVRVDRAEWEGPGGRAHRLDPAGLSTNGRAAGGGVVAFDTLDPMVFLPVAGDVARVTVEGWYEADDLPTSLANATAAAESARAEAQGLKDQAHACDEHVRELNSQVARLCKQSRESAEQLSTLGLRVFELETQLRAREHTARELETQLRAREHTARELEQYAAEMETRLRARIDQVRALTDELDQERYHHLTSTLFLDEGAGYELGGRRPQRLPPSPGRFRVGFAVGRAVRGLRWDPLELRTCRVRVDRAEWEGPGGRAHRLDPAGLSTNGRAAGGGVVAFDTLDPMVFLPVAGDVARVTVEGWYEADDLPTSLANATAAGRSTKQTPLANGHTEG